MKRQKVRDDQNKPGAPRENPDRDGETQASVRAFGRLPPMVSYAQNFEDVLLRRALRDIEHGFYIDIGAFHPVVDSVTKSFYESGWRGINVEPNAPFYALLAADRPCDINLRCAVAGRSGSARLTLMDGLSTIVPEVVQYHKDLDRGTTSVAEVEAITLNTLFERFVGDRVVDFLKLDVEGAETAILTSYAFQTVRPRILLIEATKPDSPEGNWRSWEPHVLASDYRFAWFDGLNRFYVREEDSERIEALALPPNVHDHFLFAPNDSRISAQGQPRDFGSLAAELTATRRERDAARAELEALSQAGAFFERVAPAALAQGELLGLRAEFDRTTASHAEALVRLEAELTRTSASHGELLGRLEKADAELAALRVQTAESEALRVRTAESEASFDRIAPAALAQGELIGLRAEFSRVTASHAGLLERLGKAEADLAASRVRSEENESLKDRCEALSSEVMALTRERVEIVAEQTAAKRRLDDLQSERDSLHRQHGPLMHDLERLTIQLARAEIKLRADLTGPHPFGSAAASAPKVVSPS